MQVPEIDPKMRGKPIGQGRGTRVRVETPEQEAETEAVAESEAAAQEKAARTRQRHGQRARTLGQGTKSVEPTTDMPGTRLRVKTPEQEAKREAAGVDVGGQAAVGKARAATLKAAPFTTEPTTKGTGELFQGLPSSRSRAVHEAAAIKVNEMFFSSAERAMKTERQAIALRKQMPKIAELTKQGFWVAAWATIEGPAHISTDAALGIRQPVDIPTFIDIDITIADSEEKASRMKPAVIAEASGGEHRRTYVELVGVYPPVITSENKDKDRKKDPFDQILEVYRTPFIEQNKTIFHILNGTSMQEMLKTLMKLKSMRDNPFKDLVKNFDSAIGVDRARLWVAINAVELKGKPYATDTLRSDLAVEFAGLPEDQKNDIEIFLGLKRP